MLLKEIIAGFPANHIKSACETVLKLMPTGTTIVVNIRRIIIEVAHELYLTFITFKRLCVMQVLHGLCSSRPEAVNFPPALNARLVSHILK